MLADSLYSSVERFPLHAPTPAYYALWRVYHEEHLATFYFGDGLSYDFAQASEYITQHYRYLADFQHLIWLDDSVALKQELQKLLRRMTGSYCTSCRVFCEPSKHFCHTCLMLAPLFSAPSACTCVESCFYSRPAQHARALYTQQQQPRKKAVVN